METTASERERGRERGKERERERESKQDYTTCKKSRQAANLGLNSAPSPHGAVLMYR